MSDSQFHIAGSSAIVTGSSSGIGRWIAERFAADGIDVVVCSREQENVDPVAEAINESEKPGRAIAVECDVTDWDEMEALREATLEEFGSIDILINNAGASFPCPFEDLSLNAWRTIVDINLTGAFVATRVVGEHMRSTGDGGTIVNISSTAARDGSPKMTHYAAAKAGMENLTRTLGVEWAPDEIRVNCVAPGLIATAELEEDTGVVASEIDQDSVDRQIGHPDEIATAVQFLCSPAASYIQGETLVVEGKPRIAKTPHHEN
jgi:NAD(P)-dependent dehydrogenase (short-subunit alcohol dehydrogenase family)